MQSQHQLALRRIAAVSFVLLTPLNGCAPGDVNQEDAADLAAEFEAGANTAVDETEAQVLRERANLLREIGEGDEAEKDRVRVVGE